MVRYESREGFGARIKRRWSELGRRGRYDLAAQQRPSRGFATICGTTAAESPEPRLSQGFRIHTETNDRPLPLRGRRFQPPPKLPHQLPP
ncbi:unnamed protein product, partial [Nesidiocoris tenuis]